MLILKSVTIRRTILLVSLGIVLASALTLFMYQWIETRIFMTDAFFELTPEQRALAENVAFAERFAIAQSLRIASLLSILVLIPLCAAAAIRIVRPLYSVSSEARQIVGVDVAAPLEDISPIAPHHLLISRKWWESWWETWRSSWSGSEAEGIKAALAELSRRIDMAQDELAQERARALRILNSLDEGIVHVDAAGTVNQMNPPMADALPVQPGQALPEPLLSLVKSAMDSREQKEINMPQGERVWACKALPMQETPIADGELDTEADARGHQTREKNVEKNTEKNIERNIEKSAVCVLRDATEAVRLEQTRRDYIANVSHELRSPLTALRCMIEPLRDGLIKNEDSKREVYDVLLSETLRMSRLVDDMLELSRLQSGKLALEKSEFNLIPLIVTAIDAAQTRADMKSQRISRVLPRSLPACYSNPDRIEQILTALLDNAVKFTPDNGEIEVTAVPRDGFIEVSVSDTGPGIPPESLPRVFDRFYKADTAHSGGGTGLGLAIAKELTDLLGETIHAGNNTHGGAALLFTVHTCPTSRY